MVHGHMLKRTLSLTFFFFCVLVYIGHTLPGSNPDRLTFQMPVRRCLPRLCCVLLSLLSVRLPFYSARIGFHAFLTCPLHIPSLGLACLLLRSPSLSFPPLFFPLLSSSLLSSSLLFSSLLCSSLLFSSLTFYFLLFSYLLFSSFIFSYFLFSSLLFSSLLLSSLF